MYHLKLTKNKVFSWHQANGIVAKGYLFAPDGKLYRDAGLISYFDSISNENDFREKLLSANGTFSVIVQSETSVCFAVDRFRYFPLFYRIKGKDLVISDTVDDLFDADERKKLDENAALSLSGFGYVLGNKTLLKTVFQVQAGEYIISNDLHISANFYHQYFSEIKNISFEESKQQLKNILRNIGKRMSQVLDNRPVLLPLSGGFDSRLIAYLLKKEGVKNVLCFTYGKKEGNPEWKCSQMVAERLRFSWMFIDYTTIQDTDFYQEKQFIDSADYTAQYISKCAVTQYFAANYLLDELKTPSHSVILPGHGGDFFSGAYLFPYMQHYKSLSTIAKDLQYIRCNLVQLDRKDRLKTTLWIREELEERSPIFQNVDNWVLKEIHAKHIVNTNKLWEYRGIDSFMPLCDIELMDFFIALPFDYRIHQQLYTAVIAELFTEFDINFSQDKKPHKATLVQQLKLQIKRLCPSLRKTKVFLYDYFDFQRLMQPIVKELQSKTYRKILSLNGIFSEWYLSQVKKKL